MKKFIFSTLKFTSPIIGLLLLYIYIDPCHVIWDFGEYPAYKARNAALNSYMRLAALDSIPYNSFIVGSSRSLNWPWQEWEKHLDSTAMAYHLNTSGDGILRALEKLQFAYRQTGKVDNVLLLVDHETLREITEPDDIQFRIPWQMKEQKDYWTFQLAALRYFLSKAGMNSYLRKGEEYKFTLPMYTDERGESHYIGKEWAIICDPEYYYKNLAKQHIEYYRFKQRDSIEHIDNQILHAEHIELLSQIHELFVDGNTNYKIVVSPLYDQIKLNPADKSILDSIFGAENVYDYSGINKYTQDSLNYYESSHYRPRVATQIMNEIYGATDEDSGQ